MKFKKSTLNFYFQGPLFVKGAKKYVSLFFLLFSNTTSFMNLQGNVCIIQIMKLFLKTLATIRVK